MNYKFIYKVLLFPQSKINYIPFSLGTILVQIYSNGINIPTTLNETEFFLKYGIR